MKKITHILKAAPRQLVLRLLARFHCGLVAGILFAVAFSSISLLGISYASPESAFWRGILFALPSALCFYAAKRLPVMWQFLLASALLCGLSWILIGHPGGPVLTALMALFRAKNRMQEAEGGPPVRSFFDAPTYWILLVFLGAFLLSAGMALPSLQRLSLLGAALYFLLCLGFRGLSRIDDYLTLNQDMRNLPARRIQRIAGGAVFAGLLFSAALLLPQALGSSGGFRIILPDFKDRGSHVYRLAEDPPANNSYQAQIDFLENLEPAWQIPPFVTNLILGIILAGLLVVAIIAVWKLFKEFGRSYTDGSRDFVQSLTKEDQDESGSREEGFGKIRRPSFWDRSPNAAIRRRYRRAIEKSSPQLPSPSLTPTQLEKHAGLEIPLLHNLYEQARYGARSCTPEDLRSLR